MAKKLFAILSLLVLLCGCSATEPNEKYLVSAIGVEPSDESTVLYYKITDIAASDTVGSQAVKTVSARGESISSAAENMALGLELEPSLSHCEILILSENADKKLFDQVLSFCRKNGVPLKTKLAVTGELDGLFSEDNTLSGSQLSGMLKVVSDTHGFGGHTALFEIETAVKTNDGGFALPYFAKVGNTFGITGLGLYKNSEFSRHIGVYDSAKYAKENEISEEAGS